jgi:hypothetical protein
MREPDRRREYPALNLVMHELLDRVDQLIAEPVDRALIHFELWYTRSRLTPGDAIDGTMSEGRRRARRAL